ncbi:MAG: DUF1287 domain-containing protein, partial [Deltaproteobacteria bacterium]|nr:DUF1287 domain-containing protein [Deltaproteobacteria bacterium]
SEAHALLFTIEANVNLREGPGLEYRVIKRLKHNQTLFDEEKSGEWFKVKTGEGIEGYIHKRMVKDTWIKIQKDERKLLVLKGEDILKIYNIALCPFNPDKDKVKQGDGGTPEGRFYICEMLKEPKQEKYGARSIRLSYPNIEDARRGLKDKLIDYDIYKGILKGINLGNIPDQRTVLGGSIRIHGGGNSRDWTLGCAGMDDDDIIELFDMVGAGTRVEVYRNKKQDEMINSSDYLNKKILEGAKKQLLTPALYTKEASGLIKMSYPMGDISEKEAVCTDIIIRALRYAGVDLQALVHEHILLSPGLYKNINKIDYNIDHRRTRNLQIYLSHNAEIIYDGKGEFDKAKIKPGDIVILDTGIRNGTVFDHIGIIDDEIDSIGKYRVINIWTTGYRTESMSLLGRDYPEVVGVFRLNHPFDYQ